MKTLKTLLKPISYLLAFLILMQGCTVYKKQNISLEQAVETKYKVKLITKENEKQKYLYVSTNNGEYYGTKKVNNEIIILPLQEENIKILRAKDKAASNIVTILTFSVGTLVLVGGLALATADWCYFCND